MVKAVRHEDHEARHHRIAKAATGLAGLADQRADESNARPQESKENMIDVALDGTTLQRWRAIRSPSSRKCCTIPRPASRSCCCEPSVEFMRHAFALDDDGRLQVSRAGVRRAEEDAARRRSLRMIVLVMVLLRNDGRFAEGYCVANDFDQAQSRVFTVIRRIVEVSPLLKAEARITADRISSLRSMRASRRLRPTRRLPLVATRRSVASTNCGATPPSVRRRLWDEMITSPARKISCRLTTTYAGFSGESVLLEELHKRGMALPDEVGRACVRATACCSRGTPSRLRRGRTSAGWRRCGAACGRVPMRA